MRSKERDFVSLHNSKYLDYYLKEGGFFLFILDDDLYIIIIISICISRCFSIKSRSISFLSLFRDAMCVPFKWLKVMARRSNDLNNSSKRALRRNHLIVQGLNQFQTFARQSPVGRCVSCKGDIQTEPSLRVGRIVCVHP